MIHHRTKDEVRRYDIFKLIVLLVLLLALLFLWLTGQSKPRTETVVEPVVATEPTAAVEPTATAKLAEPAPPPVIPGLNLAGLKPVAGEAVALSGSGQPGGSVEIVLDGQVIGTAPVDADGNWTFDANLPDPGDFKLDLRSLDAGGALLAQADPVDLTVAEPAPMGAGAAPAETASAKTITGGEAYIVQAGDWLSKLADKYYNDISAYPVIVEATNVKAKEDATFTVIDNPDLIEVGQKLWIPALTE